MKSHQIFSILLLASLSLTITNCSPEATMPQSLVVEISGPPNGVVIFSAEEFFFSTSGNSRSASSSEDYGPVRLGEDGKQTVHYDDQIDGLRFRIVAIDDEPLTLAATPDEGEPSSQTVEGKFQHATIEFGRTYNEDPGHPFHDSPEDTIYVAKKYLEELNEEQDKKSES